MTECLFRMAKVLGRLEKVVGIVDEDRVRLDEDLFPSATYLCRWVACLGRFEKVLGESAQDLILSAAFLFLSTKDLFLSAKVGLISAKDLLRLASIDFQGGHEESLCDPPAVPVLRSPFDRDARVEPHELTGTGASSRFEVRSAVSVEVQLNVSEPRRLESRSWVAHGRDQAGLAVGLVR